MLMLLQLLLAACGIGSLVCFILVLVKMFQHGQTGLGIACIVLVFCGIGGLVAFVVGWMNHAKWNIKNVMLAWTALFVASLVLYGLTLVMAMGAAVNAPV
jgi:hypothetical protein